MRRGILTTDTKFVVLLLLLTAMWGEAASAGARAPFPSNLAIENQQPEHLVRGIGAPLYRGMETRLIRQGDDILVQSLARNGYLPDLMERCRTSMDLLMTILTTHYRRFDSREERVTLSRKAYAKLFHFLDLPENVTAEDAARRFRLDEGLRDNGESLPVDCIFPYRVSLLGAPVTPAKVWDAYFNALLSEMDPHSWIAEGREAQNLDELTSGKMVGIGVRLEKTETGVLITHVRKEGSAQEAGLVEGDRILEVINGEKHLDSVKAKVEETTAAIKSGPAGSKVVLRVARASGGEETIPVERREIKVEYVVARDLPGGLLHLAIEEFGKGMTNQVEAEIQARPGIKGVILDLRFTPGGLMWEAHNLIDLLTPEPAVIYSVWSGVKGLEYRTQSLDRFEVTAVPLVVLVNRFSASAAEIVAQGVVDFGRGVVGGEPSFGKASVQKVINLPEGRELVLTFAMYHTQGGGSPQILGVIPSVEVPNSPKMEDFLVQRRKLKDEGASVPPMYEREMTPYLPHPPDLPAEIRRALGGVVDRRPFDAFVAHLDLQGVVNGLAPTADPGVTAASAILTKMAESCPTYHVARCDTPPLRLGAVDIGR